MHASSQIGQQTTSAKSLIATGLLVVEAGKLQGAVADTRPLLKGAELSGSPFRPGTAEPAVQAISGNLAVMAK